MTTVHAAYADLSAYPSAKSRLRTFAREIGFIAAAALLYSLVRGLTDDRVEVAFSNAERVISFEKTVGLFIEPDLQGFALRNDVVPNLANAVYIAYWPIIIGTVLWLLIRRPRAYPLYRNAFLASGGLSLALFALVPLAPPRFLPEHGFTDTIAANSDGYRELNASALVNEYAAMPSLHFGWVLLASIATARLTTNQLARMAAMAAPPLMLTAIVLTGNHYLLDAAAGAAVVLAGLAIATAAARARQVRTSTGRDASSEPAPSPASPPSAPPPAHG